MTESDSQAVKRRAEALDGKDTWMTPPWLVELLQGHVTIDLDPCAADATGIGEMNYTLPQHDGLEEDWYGTVYVNMPFSQKKQWIQKAIDEYENGDVDRAIILTPDSTDTISWWHSKLAANCDAVWFSEGRIKYLNPAKGGEQALTNPTFGTALNFMGDFPESLYDALDEEGDVCVRWSEIGEVSE